ncbi:MULTISPECIES: hypothetical protein [Streptomyces]|uniref:hypothetical protein n=1 Tax=Streptomyces TaxID=1883 RepID=UPI0033A8CC59
MRQVLPDLDWHASAEGTSASAKTGDDPPDHLPIQVFDWCHPLDRAEPFIPAMGPDPAAVGWDLNAWPAIPEAGLDVVSQKYAYLTLAVHSRDLAQCEPSEDHTTYVHVPDEHHVARIEWLAGRVGGRYTGRIELSPL